MAKLFELILICLVPLSLSTAHAQQPGAAETAGPTNAADCLRLITVAGEVRAPARLEVRRKTPPQLIEVLVLSGGLTEMAGKTVRIFHAATSSDCEMSAANNLYKIPESGVTTLNVGDVLSRQDGANPALQPGDIVIVSRYEVAYVVGNVVRPQPIILKEPTTVSQAIARAGGLLPDAQAERTFIHRFRPGNVNQIKIPINLKAIRKGQAEDLLLQPYDVLDVSGKGGHPMPPLFFKVTPQPKPELIWRVIY